MSNGGSQPVSQSVSPSVSRSDSFLNESFNRSKRPKVSFYLRNVLVSNFQFFPFDMVNITTPCDSLLELSIVRYSIRLFPQFDTDLGTGIGNKHIEVRYAFFRRGQVPVYNRNAAIKASEREGNSELLYGKGIAERKY